jgi:hypothetical protein
MRRLCRFAVRKELISVDPTIGIARYAENPDGYHTWTDLEIEQSKTSTASNPRPSLHCA